MGAGCVRTGALAADAHEPGAGAPANHVNSEVANPQPSTSGVNGAVVHAGTKGRDNFLRPDLQREHLVTSSDSEADLATLEEAGFDADDDEEEEEPEGVLFVQECAVDSPESDGDSRRGPHGPLGGGGGGRRNRTRKQRRNKDPGGRHGSSRDRRSEGRGEPVGGSVRRRQAAPKTRQASVQGNTRRSATTVMSTEDAPVLVFHRELTETDQPHGHVSQKAHSQMTEEPYPHAQQGYIESTQFSSDNATYITDDQYPNRRIKADETLGTYPGAPNQYYNNNEVIEDLIIPELASNRVARMPKHQEYNDQWRDYFSSMSVASDDFQQDLVLRDSLVVRPKYVSRLTIEPVQPSDYASSYTDEYYLEQKEAQHLVHHSRLLPDYLIDHKERWQHPLSAAVRHREYSSTSSRQHDFSSATEQYRDQSSTNSPYRRSSPDISEIDLCSDDEVAAYSPHTYQPTTTSKHADPPKSYEHHKQSTPDIFQYPDNAVMAVKHHTRPSRVNHLPSSTLRQFPLGGHYSPIQLEYSVFSPSCSASDIDLSDVMTCYSSTQESFESEFLPFNGLVSNEFFEGHTDIILWGATNGLGEYDIELPTLGNSHISTLNSETKAAAKTDVMNIELNVTPVIDMKDEEDVSYLDTYSGVSSLSESPILVITNQSLQHLEDQIKQPVCKQDLEPLDLCSETSQNQQAVNKKYLSSVETKFIQSVKTSQKTSNTQYLQAPHPLAIVKNEFLHPFNKTFDPTINTQTDDTHSSQEPSAISVTTAVPAVSITSSSTTTLTPITTRVALKAIQIDVKIQTEKNMSTQTESEVATQTDSEMSTQTDPPPQYAVLAEHSQKPAVVLNPVKLNTAQSPRSFTMQPVEETVTHQEMKAAYNSQTSSKKEQVLTNKPIKNSTPAPGQQSTKKKLDRQNTFDILLNTPVAKPGKYQQIETLESFSSRSTGRRLPHEPQHRKEFASCNKKRYGKHDSKAIPRIRSISQTQSQYPPPLMDSWGYSYDLETRLPYDMQRHYMKHFEHPKVNASSSNSSSSSSANRRRLPCEPDHPEEYSPDPFKRSNIPGKVYVPVKRTSQMSRTKYSSDQVYTWRTLPMGRKNYQANIDHGDFPSKLDRLEKSTTDPVRIMQVPIRKQIPAENIIRNDNQERNVPFAKAEVSSKWKYIMQDNSEDSDTNSDVTVMEVPILKTACKRSKSPVKQFKNGSYDPLKLQDPVKKGREMPFTISSLQMEQHPPNDSTRIQPHVSQNLKNKPIHTCPEKKSMTPKSKSHSAISQNGTSPYPATFDERSNSRHISSTSPGSKLMKQKPLHFTNPVDDPIHQLPQLASCSRAELSVSRVIKSKASPDGIALDEMSQLSHKGNTFNARSKLQNHLNLGYHEIKSTDFSQAKIIQNNASFHDHMELNATKTDLLKTPTSIFQPSYNPVLGQQKVMPLIGISEQYLAQSPLIPKHEDPSLSGPSTIFGQHNFKSLSGTQTAGIGEHNNTTSPISDISISHHSKPQNSTFATEISQQHYISPAIKHNNLLLSARITDQHYTPQTPNMSVPHCTATDQHHSTLSSGMSGSYITDLDHEIPESPHASAYNMPGKYYSVLSPPTSRHTTPESEISRHQQHPALLEGITGQHHATTSSGISRKDQTTLASYTSAPYYTTLGPNISGQTYTTPAAGVIGPQYTVPVAELSGQHQPIPAQSIPRPQQATPITTMHMHQHNFTATNIPRQDHTSSATSIPRKHLATPITIVPEHQYSAPENNIHVKHYIIPYTTAPGQNYAASSVVGMPRQQVNANPSSNISEQQNHTPVTHMPGIQHITSTTTGPCDMVPQTRLYQDGYKLPASTGIQHASKMSQLEIKLHDPYNAIPDSTYLHTSSEIAHSHGKSNQSNTTPQAIRSLSDSIHMNNSAIGFSQPSSMVPPTVTTPQMHPYAPVRKAPPLYSYPSSIPAHQNKQLNNITLQPEGRNPKSRFDIQQEKAYPNPLPSPTSLDAPHARYERQGLSPSQMTASADLIPIQTIPEKDKNVTKEGHGMPKVIVPGKRIKASYLTAQGEQVVILAPGIGENVPLGTSPWQQTKREHMIKTNSSVELGVRSSVRPNAEIGMKSVGKLSTKPSFSTIISTAEGCSHFNDPLKVAPRPLHVQPTDRIPRSKRSRDSAVPEVDAESDMDVSDASSVASAGMFEHVAKMSRITDQKPPQGALPLRFRSAVVPMSEVANHQPQIVINGGGDVTGTPSETDSEHNNSEGVRVAESIPAVRLRADVLGAQHASSQRSESPTGSRRHSKQKNSEKQAKLDVIQNDSDALVNGKNGSKRRRGQHQAAVSPEVRKSSDRRRASMTESEGSRQHSPELEKKSGKTGSKTDVAIHNGSRRSSEGTDRERVEHKERSKHKDKSEHKEKSKYRSRSGTRRHNAVGDSSFQTASNPASENSANGSPTGRTPAAGRSAAGSPASSHPTSPQGTPVKSAGSSRQGSRKASLDGSVVSTIEERAQQEKKINKQRHQSRDRDNYDQREHEKPVKENQENGSAGRRSRQKKKDKGWGVTVRKSNAIDVHEPPPSPSPPAKKMAEVRTQRWKKTTEVSTDIIEEKKKGRNMRAAPRSAQGSDDLRQVVTKDQMALRSPGGAFTPPIRRMTSECADPEMLLDRLLHESNDATRNLDAETAARQLIHVSYEEEEHKSHSARCGEEVELRNHVQRHLVNGRSKSRVPLRDRKHIECHLQTSLGTDKVADLLTQAFPLANLTMAKILHNDLDATTVPTSKSPYSTCGGESSGHGRGRSYGGHGHVLSLHSGYTSDTNTNVSQVGSAYDLILNHGSATGLHNYGLRIEAVPHRGNAHPGRAVAHSAPGSAGSASVPCSPRARGAWHGDADADRVAEEVHVVSKKQRTKSVSPRQSARSARPRSACRSSSYDVVNKQALLDAPQDQLPESHMSRGSKRAKKIRPMSAKR